MITASPNETPLRGFSSRRAKKRGFLLGLLFPIREKLTSYLYIRVCMIHDSFFMILAF